MEKNVVRDSPMGTVTPGTPPMDSALAPLRGAGQLKHYSEREVQRQERRLKARGKAVEMLEAAVAVRSDQKLAAVAALVVRKLNVEYCDILQFASDRWVVVARAKGGSHHSRGRIKAEILIFQSRQLTFALS